MKKEQKFSTRFADLQPRHSAEEKAAMKASVAVYGVLNPVLFDEEGNLLDGRYRLELDPNAPRKVIKGLGSDAEKRAFVFQCSHARRNLTPDQKQELSTKQRKVAEDLRKQDPKTFTLKVIAEKLGVATSTVSRWLDNPTGTNLHVQNGSGQKPDARPKVSPADRQKIAKRVAAGESKAKLGREYDISAQAIGKIAKAINKKASDKQSTADAEMANGEAQQIPMSQQRVEEASAVPIASAQHGELEQSAPTPFDDVIGEVQAMLERLASCDNLSAEINRLIPGTVDVGKNKKVTGWLTNHFVKVLKKLEGKAAAFIQQPAEDDLVQDDKADPVDEVDDDSLDDEDDADTGRPSLPVRGKVG